MTDHPPETTGTAEPIPAHEARALLETAIRARLGEDWDDEQTGWAVVTRHDYMARLTRGKQQIDFYVDLLGNVTVEDTGTSPAQERLRLLTWFFLGGSVLAAFIIARLADFI